MSQAELGSKLGLGQRAIAHWERRQTAVLPNHLDALARVLNVSIDELISGNGRHPVESGPKGKARRLFEQLSKLPRSQQQHVITVLEAFVEKKFASS